MLSGRHLLVILVGLVLAPSVCDGQRQRQRQLAERGVRLEAYRVGYRLTRATVPEPHRTPDVSRVAYDFKRNKTDLNREIGTEGFVVTVQSAKLRIDEAGTYGFDLARRSIAEFFIDGKRVLWHRQLGGPTEGVRSRMQADVELTAGEHELRLVCFDDAGRTMVELGWRPPGEAVYEPIPRAVLSPTAESEPIDNDERLRLLVFTKTAGFRHRSIPDGISCLYKMGDRHDFDVVSTEDARVFAFEEDAGLAKFDGVVFLNTTGDVLDEAQQDAMERFVRAGGAYIGIHSAADTEYDWAWYGQLVGAYFMSHPEIQLATVRVHRTRHPSTKHLGEVWIRRDEWYDYREPPVEGVKVLLSLDESTYRGGRMGVRHPIAWCHEFDGGRSFYTGGGHTSEAFTEAEFVEHIWGGIRWATKQPEPKDEHRPRRRRRR